jgi:hypothetical protein
LGDAAAATGKERKMAEETDTITGTGMEQIKIALNVLYLCIDHAIKHIAEAEGVEAAHSYKADLLESLKNGDIDMALLEENRTFDLIVSKIEALVVPSPPEG